MNKPAYKIELIWGKVPKGTKPQLIQCRSIGIIYNRP